MNSKLKEYLPLLTYAMNMKKKNRTKVYGPLIDPSTTPGSSYFSFVER